MSYFPGNGSGWQVPADYSARHRSSIRPPAVHDEPSDSALLRLVRVVTFSVVIGAIVVLIGGSDILSLIGAV